MALVATACNSSVSESNIPESEIQYETTSTSEVSIINDSSDLELETDNPGVSSGGI